MSELDQAVKMFKDAAKKSGFYAEREIKEVVLRKGSTLLIKTDRAHEGRAIVNA